MVIALLSLVYPCFELDIKQDLQCANPCQSSNKLNKLNVLHLFAISYYLRVIRRHLLDEAFIRERVLRPCLQGRRVTLVLGLP